MVSIRFLLGRSGRMKEQASEPVSVPAPSSEKLLLASGVLLKAVEDLQPVMEERYYTPLAEITDKRDAGREALEDEIQQELATLHAAANDLQRAHQGVISMSDELRARARDTQRSVDRKLLRPNPPANGAIDLKEKQKDHFAQGLNIYKILLVLAVGSFAGVIVEMLWCYLTNGYFESRRGLVYGPFNLLYGAGAAALSVALYKYRNRGFIWSFLGGFIVGSVLEYLCSWGQEMLIGSTSWDYSNMPLNLNGRICFAYSIFWGVLGVLWIKDLYPRMAKLILKIPNRIGKVLTWALTIFLIFDAVVSCVAVGRWSQRVKGELAENGFWEMVDQRFPDQRMERIFANMEFDTQD